MWEIFCLHPTQYWLVAFTCCQLELFLQHSELSRLGKFLLSPDPPFRYFKFPPMSEIYFKYLPLPPAYLYPAAEDFHQCVRNINSSTAPIPSCWVGLVCLTKLVCLTNAWIVRTDKERMLVTCRHVGIHISVAIFKIKGGKFPHQVACGLF